MDTPLLSFRVLGVGDFGSGPGASSGTPIEWFGKGSVDDAISELGVTIDVEVPRVLHEDGSLALSFSRFKDFRPEKILLTNKFTKGMVEARDFAEKALADGTGPDEVMNRVRMVPGLGDLNYSSPRKGSIQPEKSSSAVEEILKIVAVPDEQKGVGPGGRAIVDAINDRLAQFLRAFYSSPALRSLESTWSGAKKLFDLCATVENAEVGLMDTGGELEDVLDKLLISLPLDLPSLILFDSSFDNSPRSFLMLEKVADICESLLVPGVIELSPAFFALEDWNELEKRPYLPHYLQEQAYAKWQSLRNKASSRWLVASCNRFLARDLYGSGSERSTIPFSEKEYLWVSPIWAVGALAVKSLEKYGWPSRITDWKNCLLEDLPVRVVGSKAAYPTEAGLSEDRVTQFAKAGIIALSSSPNRDIAFVPFDSTTGGSSLGYQLLLSMTVQLLMWCRDHFAENLPSKDIEESLRAILVLLWQKRGYDISDKIEVSVVRPEEEEKYVVGLRLELPREVLREGGTISLEMPW